uniref:F-box protein SKIP31 n=1 Tax=Anthurium amnicola TaxID=1678845 RepID=A0A1D1Z5G5_9ARAE
MPSAAEDGVDGGAGEEDETLAHFLESEILSVEDHVLPLRPPPGKRPRLEAQENGDEEEEEEPPPAPPIPSPLPQAGLPLNKAATVQIDTGFFSRVPPELFRHIFKFLSSEDLVSCSLACKFMNFAASDECLWRRLYCIRWGQDSRIGKLRQCAWKKLYIQRDGEDMVHFIGNCPSEFKEYYIQMQAAKRSQAPLPSQVYDDSVILDKTVAEQVSIWKSSRGLTDELIGDHTCSGDTCTYTQIGDVFLCEKTGRVHVCDDTCREVILDQLNGHFVCTISGRVFDNWLSSENESNMEQGDVGDEAEPFLGSGRFARAYCLGYNCDDEEELEAALRFC